MDSARKPRIFKLIVAFSFLSIADTAFSDTNEKQFGRYLTSTQEEAMSETVLDMQIQREFPKTVKTIGEAIEYTLKGTGYKLLSAELCSTDIKDLYKYELPFANQKIPPSSLQKALLSLAGQAYQIVLDPIHRQITFKLRRDYQGL